MNNYRISYWKTTLVAAFGAFSFGSLLLLCLVNRHITFFGYTWASENHPLVFWLACICFLGMVLIFSAVTLGGGICLYSDAKDNLKDKAPEFEHNTHVNA